MKEELSFEADAAIIARLGRELVAKQETALIELVKNGFDADATKVDVVFEGSGPSAAVEVRDNGTGMTRRDLVQGFMRLASDLKVQSPRSPRFGRRRAGRKGIGRFAAQRLGDRLVLITRTEAAAAALRLNVDWRQFVHGRRLEDVRVSLDEVPATDAPGTTIRIENLRDTWSEAQTKRCWRGVLALQQPFPVAPVIRKDDADPGFSVRILQSGSIFDDEYLVANMQTEILDHLHAVIEMKVDDKGRAKWRLSKNQFGSVRDWMPIHHDHRDTAWPPPYEHLKNAAMKAYYAVLDPTLLPSLVYTRVRDVLSDEGGIRLYRNGFRVIPYGDPDDDWLRLDEAYAKRSLLAPIANRNFFGVIELEDPDGNLFEEHTSREGLIESLAFLELKELASSVLVTAGTQMAEDRGRKTYAGRTSRPLITSNFSGFGAVRAAARAAKEAAELAAREKGTPAAEAAVKRATETVNLVEKEQEELEAAQIRLADEAAMLRFLATLGMTTSEFSHETGMTFDAFRLDFKCVFDAAAQARSNDPTFKDQAARAQAMLNRLDTLTSYLNALAAARSLRSIRPVSLSKTVDRFKRGIGAQAKSQEIEVTIDTPAYDGLFTRPMHEAELASILLNFYTNSVKAMKRSKNRRKILVVADRTDDLDPRVRIRFSDTGDGIPSENRDRIFDAFFTTRIAPPAGASDTEHASGSGLGLWIVSQIASNAGGEVLLAEPPPGFSTCFEVLLPPEEENAE
jgi:signal transduction histidine kinase